MTSDQEAMDDLNDFLDELARAGARGTRPPHPRDGEQRAAWRLHRQDATPRLSPRDADRMWQTLKVDRTIHPPATPSPIMSAARAALRAIPSQTARAIGLIAAAAILIVMVGGYAAYQWASPSPSEPRAARLTVTGAPPTATTTILLTCGKRADGRGQANGNGVQLTLLQVEFNAAAPAGATPGAVNYVAAEVELINRGPTSILISADDFHLIDCGADATTPSSSGVAPRLAAGLLAPGAAERGWLTFALPFGKQPFALDYRSRAAAGATIECRLVHAESEATPSGTGPACLSVDPA